MFSPPFVSQLVSFSKLQRSESVELTEAHQEFRVGWHPSSHHGVYTGRIWKGTHFCLSLPSKKKLESVMWILRVSRI